MEIGMDVWADTPMKCAHGEGVQSVQTHVQTSVRTCSFELVCVRVCACARVRACVDMCIDIHTELSTVG